MAGVALAELTELARRAGILAMRRFRTSVPETKADRTLVTLADREVEDFLVRELRVAAPGTALLGEEGGAHGGEGSERLVIDPIDGTSAFVAGLPTWCVCIALLEGPAVLCGVIHLPCFDETYAAGGGEATWNGKRLAPLAARPPAADPFILAHAKAHLHHEITYPGKVRSLGSTAYHLALVARGAAEAALIGHVHLWDIAPGAALLAAVGGELRYLSGAPVDLGALADGRRAREFVAAGSPAALAAVLPRLHGRC